MSEIIFFLILICLAYLYSLNKKHLNLKIYDNIDNLPIYNFNKVRDTSDLSYLFKSKNLLNRFKAGKLLKIWDNIFNQFLDEFGTNEAYLEELNEERKILIMLCDRWILNDRSIETFIDKRKFELQQKRQNKKNIKFGLQLSMLSKFKGFRIDEKIITVKEFYSDLENYKNYIKNV